MPEVNRFDRRRRAVSFLLIAAFVVAVDQTSKLWLRSHVDPYEVVSILDRLSLVNVSNTGAAFGLFTDQTFLLTLVAVVGLIAVLLFYRYLPRSGVLETLALALIFGGAAGNLIDRLRFGHVTDFIYVRLWHDFYWPAFNVADSAITVGTIALACFIFWTVRKEKGHSSGAGS